MAGSQDMPLGLPPLVSTLTRTVVAVVRSWRNTSGRKLKSDRTRFIATLLNATKRPSAEIAGEKDGASPWTALEFTLTIVVVTCRALAGAADSAHARGNNVRPRQVRDRAR